jgi:hypothetical protein
MKRTIVIAGKCAALIVLFANCVVVPSMAQNPSSQVEDAVHCSGGTWTPTPIQHAESGTASQPEFHTVYGLSCGGNVFMVRFSNKVGPNSNQIVVDMLGKTPVPCSGGTWTPTPVQHAESGTASQPEFHTVYGLSCGGNVFMIRFSNKVGPQSNRIVVDSLGQTPAK